jgi:hypothetical protein
VNLGNIFAQQGRQVRRGGLFANCQDHPELNELNRSLAMLLAEQGSFEESRELL